jgi:hypothetical protein
VHSVQRKIKRKNKMKKIMILASAIAISCAANAAQYVWGLSSYDYQDKSGTPLEDGTAFFFLGTVTASDTAFDLSQATYITYGGFDANNYAYGHVDNSNLLSSDAITSTAAGQAYSIVLVDANVTTLEGYEGDYTIVTGTSNAGVLPGATNTYYADFVNGTSSAYTTSTMAVPEPTSGLLLLLGMAGLALKRKRA